LWGQKKPLPLTRGGWIGTLRQKENLFKLAYLPQDKQAKGKSENTRVGPRNNYRGTWGGGEKELLLPVEGKTEGLKSGGSRKGHSLDSSS